MTTTTFTPSRPGLLVEADRLASRWLTQVRSALAARRAFRRTLAELDALNMRQREDIGIAGLDTTEIARAASRPA